MGVFFRGLWTAQSGVVQWAAPKEITPPSAEPITLAQAKLDLKVHDSNDDALLTQRIIAVRQKVEKDTSQWVVRATYDLALDLLPSDGRLTLPYGPVSSVTSLKIYDVDDVEAIVDPDYYFLDDIGNPPRLCLDYETDPWWPDADPRSYRAGVLRVIGGPDDTAPGSGIAKASPPWAIEAMYQLLAHWHDQRAAVLIGTTGQVMPLGYQDLIESHRLSVGMV